MRRLGYLTILALTVICLAAQGLRAQTNDPTITILSTDPSPTQGIEVGVSVPIAVTVAIPDPRLNKDTARFEVLTTSNMGPIWKHATTPKGLTLQSELNDLFTYTGKIQKKALLKITPDRLFRVSATFTGVSMRVASDPLSFLVGAIVPLEENAENPVVVEGPEGSELKVEIPPGALKGEVVVSIDTVPTEETVVGGLPLTEILDVRLEPTDPVGSPLSEPVIITLPAPPDTAEGGKFWIARRVLADLPTGGLGTQLLTLDTATQNASGEIVTDFDSPILQGVFGTGELVVLEQTSTGFAKGKVVDANAVPRYGVWVRNTIGSANTQGFFTTVDGDYIVPVNLGVDIEFTIEAIDGFRCKKGTSASATLVVDHAPAPHPTNDPEVVVIPDIILNQSVEPTRDGFRNGGGEVGDLTCYQTDGTVEAIGPSPPRVYGDLFGLGTTITPPQGQWMFALRASTSELRQRFILPPPTSTLDSNGNPTPVTQKLQFDFNFGCPTASCPGTGSVPNTATVEAKLFLSPQGGSDTPVAGGTFTQLFKDFNGELGWRRGEITVPGSITAGTVLKLVLTALTLENGSELLIDDVRFDTLYVVANIMGVADTSPQQVRDQIRDANEILSQSGTSVRIRRINEALSLTGTCNPGGKDFSGLLGMDVTYTSELLPLTEVSPGNFFCVAPPNGDCQLRGLLTDDMKAILCLGPEKNSGFPEVRPSDLHLYWVEKLIKGQTEPFGVALIAEEYHSDNPPVPLDPVGIVLRNLNNVTGLTNVNRAVETPGHELGHFIERFHVVIGDQNFGKEIRVLDDLEHGAVEGVVTTSKVCEPRETSQGDLPETLCSARPIYISAQTETVNLPVIQAQSTCLAC